ncbi:BTB domain-containing protein [Mycena kentingensis (nom. inval.)]|nr:BTB domain-containing protein [Mycena kentingensis (nom. inval.)]
MSSTATLMSLQRFDDYYLPGGDLYCIAENKIFRVHRYFFERESTYFQRHLAIPATPGAPRRGTSDDSALLLENIRSEAFAKLLWVFYNPKYSLYDATVEDWSTILELADKWGFAEVKNLAVRQLEKLEMADVDRIVLYHAYSVDERFLVPRYVALCERPELLTVEEGLLLGMKTVISLTRARECARNPNSGGLTPSGMRSPSPATMSEKELTDIILDHFEINLDAEPEAEFKPAPTTTTLTPKKPAGVPEPTSNGKGTNGSTSKLDTAKGTGTKANGNGLDAATSLFSPPPIDTSATTKAADDFGQDLPAIAVPAPGTRHLEELELAKRDQTPQALQFKRLEEREARRTTTRRAARTNEGEEDDSDDSGYESSTVRGALDWDEEEFTTSYDAKPAADAEREYIQQPAQGERIPPSPSPSSARVIPSRPALLLDAAVASYRLSDSEGDEDEFFDSAEGPADA